MPPEITPRGRTPTPVEALSAPSAPEQRASHRPPQRPVIKPVPPGEGATVATDAVPDEIQRWTARRRMALVLSILRGDLSPEEGARRHGLTKVEIEDWKERMLAACHNALRSRPRDEQAIKDDQIRRLKQKVGELVIEVDTLRDALLTARSPLDEEGPDD